MILQVSDLPANMQERISVKDDCWNWTGGCLPSGHGLIRWPGYKSMRKVTHVTYEMINGPVPIGLQLNHACNNPACINPAHVYAGTKAQNVADSQKAGTYRSPPKLLGSEHPATKLTEAAVLEIRRLYATGKTTQPKLAKQFGCGQTAISNIINKVTWRHI